MLIGIIIIILSYKAASAQEGTMPLASSFNKEAFIESASQKKILRIGLVDCVAYVLRKNSEIRIKRIEPMIRKDDIKIAKADFEPTLTGSATYTDTHNEPDNISSSSLLGATRGLLTGVVKTKDTALSAGVSGKLVTGTEYSVDLATDKYKTNVARGLPNPSYSVSPSVTITQPLFKDFGTYINRANIIIAQNNWEASKVTFTKTVIDTVTAARVAYYNYIFTKESYGLALSSLKRLEDLLDANNLRYQKGLISSVDLLETETAVAEQKKALLASESALKKAEDYLKLITNLVDDPELWNAEIEPVDMPELKAKDVSLVKSLKMAFKKRPDYQASLIDLKNRDINIKLAHNDLYPTLDLVGSFGLNGLGDDYSSAVKDIDGRNNDWNRDWSVGLSFNMPWGGGERAKYDQRKLEKAQQLLSLKRLEQNIILEVRDKVREVDIQYRQVDATKAAKDTSEASYGAQIERYAAGQASTHDMLDYQDRLTKSQTDYIKALIDYNLALFNLEAAEGSTLQKNDIKIEEAGTVKREDSV